MSVLILSSKRVTYDTCKILWEQSLWLVFNGTKQRYQERKGGMTSNINSEY